MTQENVLYRPTSLTESRLREIIEYNEQTGIFTWKITQGRAIKDNQAGTFHHSGYVYIRINGQEYGAHRLAWLYIYGEFIKVDHKNRKPWDNRLENLRKTTASLNNANRILPSKSGIKGVRLTRNGTYEARIQYEYQSIQIGTFKTKEEAVKAYRDKAKELFGEFACE